jgi:hypothetical protein
MSDGPGLAGVAEVKPHIVISQDAVARLNSEGFRYTWEPLRTVDEAREAAMRMPEGRTGIVIGSGPNTDG